MVEQSSYTRPVLGSNPSVPILVCRRGMLYTAGMQTIKKNITLVIGVSIPILMILFVAGSIYLPGLFVQPKVNFLYTTGEDYYSYQYHYVVDSDKLLKYDDVSPQNTNYNQPRSETKLFVYDVVKNENKSISFDDAQTLHLDANPQSPDGFEVVYGSRGDNFFPFFFFSGTDYNSRYLKGHNVSRKINIQAGGPYYNAYYNFRFLGWIKN